MSTIVSPTMPGTYQPASINRATGSSGSAAMSISPRQTEALLPEYLSPAGKGANEQDVNGNEQQQSSLVDDARQTAEKANQYLTLADTKLRFRVSELTGRIVIDVVDGETEEVVRQIPKESMERFANQMTKMRGLLFEAEG